MRTHTLGMALDEANRALNMLKHDELHGAAVLAHRLVLPQSAGCVHTAKPFRFPISHYD